MKPMILAIALGVVSLLAASPVFGGHAHGGVSLATGLINHCRQECGVVRCTGGDPSCKPVTAPACMKKCRAGDTNGAAPAIR
jgi:hypothetical protein